MPTVEELKEQQRKQWSGNAATWDSQHESRERETAAVSEWLCREARLQSGMSELDLACGSGHPALDIARIVGRNGKVVATDLVPEMVEVTRRRAGELGLDNLEARVMDAEALDFVDETFDAVTCRFGLMFCPRPDRAFEEIRRVLRPGGRLALCVWSVPEDNPGQTVQGEALRRFGRPQPPVDVDAPGVYQLAPSGKLEGLLRAAGFRDIHIEPLTLTSEYESPEAFLARGLRTATLRAALEEATPEEAERLNLIVAGVLSDYTRDGVIRLAMTSLCAAATR